LIDELSKRGDERGRSHVASNEFKMGLSEMYQGETAGEIIVCRWLERFDTADQRYKLGSLLQLETEAKARLRPAVMALGLDLSELDDAQKLAEKFHRASAGMDWQAFVAHLATAVEPYVRRFREIAEIAPPEYKDLADSMVVHELSWQRFARLEIAGDIDRSIDDVVKQLIHPLPKPT
jgi:hypothetical protein